MATPTIAVEGVSKRFRLRASGGRSLKTFVLDTFRRGHGREDFWALQDVSFSVEAGETLGIIGSNGAGKSTLLSLLAGTKIPTRGTIATHGTISSLLELGAGFHPELTGRENVFLSGAIMGLSRQQMQQRFDAIVDFAGIETFIDQPVKHYSSGMYVRLGFAVAVEVDPDILLIDEVLAVGDADFQRKCIKKMDAFRKAGKTMLVISHDLHTIQSISDRILFLEAGKVLGIGAPDTIVNDYQARSRSDAAKGLGREWGTGQVSLTEISITNDDGRVTDRFESGQGLRAQITYRASEKVKRPVFGFAIADCEGRLVHGSNTQIAEYETGIVDGDGHLTLAVDGLPLASGDYLLSFSVHSEDHRENYHRLDNQYAIHVESPRRFEGCVDLPSRWVS